MMDVLLSVYTNPEIHFFLPLSVFPTIHPNVNFNSGNEKADWVMMRIFKKTMEPVR